MLRDDHDVVRSSDGVSRGETAGNVMIVGGGNVRGVAVTLEHVATLALALPEVTEGERYRNRAWSVGGKVFAWERPFSKADIERYGDETPPDGPIVGVKVADLSDKEAVLAEGRPGFFTIPHFDGFAAVLVQLTVVRKADMRRALVDGWLACAPSALADAHAASLIRPSGVTG
jgi:hypothetical protein